MSDDFVVTRTTVGDKDAVLVYFQTISDQKQVQSMKQALQKHKYQKVSPKEMPYYLARHVIPFGEVMFMDNLWEIREALSRGDILLLVDGISEAITVASVAIPHRAIEPPLLESSTRGPQISFIEKLDVNIGLMRGMLISDALTVKELRVGYRSRTRVAMLYEHDVANPNLVSTAMKRIQAVHVDKLTGSATLEQRIVDNHWTLFPLTRSTTRVDNCVKEVGQGKVLILVDGDPTGFLIPGTVVDFFQTMEDDQHSYFEATFMRWLRFVSFVLGFYLPALYISFADFNPELMPHTLALQIARSREGVPFNAATEVMMMQLVIEIIREAALRMPRVMGQTIGIVGGLVLRTSGCGSGVGKQYSHCCHRADCSICIRPAELRVCNGTSNLELGKYFCCFNLWVLRCDAGRHGAGCSTLLLSSRLESLTLNPYLGNTGGISSWTESYVHLSLCSIREHHTYTIKK